MVSSSPGGAGGRAKCEKDSSMARWVSTMVIQLSRNRVPALVSSYILRAGPAEDVSQTEVTRPMASIWRSAR